VKTPYRGTVGAIALVITLVLLSAGDFWAQSQPRPVPQTPRAATLTKRKLGALDISGSWRVRLEAWDWFDGGSGNSSYVFPHSILRVALGQERSHIDWQVEAAQVTFLRLPTDATAPAPQGQLGLGGTYFAANGAHRDVAMGFMKQAFVRFKGANGAASLRLGRFEFLDGAEIAPKDSTLATLVQARIAQRLIGNFAWPAVGRSYDGIQLAYNAGNRNVTLVAGRPTRGVFQADAMGELDVDLYYGAFSASVGTERSAGKLRLFALGYVDHRTAVLKTDNRPQAARTADREQIVMGTYGADYLHVFNTPSSGKFDVLLWGAIQNGAWGVLTHRAGAVVGEFGWQIPLNTIKPWTSVGYSYGSGDGNPSDSRHRTFFQVLPTPRLFARFPFYNMENNEDIYATLNLSPHPRLSLRSELHALRLDRQNDLWYQGGGAFQAHTFGYAGRPANNNRSLANAWDISADYRVTQSFAANFYYAHAWGKTAIASIYPNDRNAQLAYVETNLRF
jgi:Alginate export